MKPSLSFGLVCLLALFSLAGPALATRFVPLSIEELSRSASIIVQGTVRSKTCARDPGGSIFTKVELAVIETWKGQTGTNLTIIQSGGILGEEGAVIPGQANYEIGEEVVAFLVLNSRQEAITLGLAHGKFHVWKHPETGEKLARNIFHGGGPLQSPRQQNALAKSSLTLVDLKRCALERKP